MSRFLFGLVALLLLAAVPHAEAGSLDRRHHPAMGAAELPDDAACGAGFKAAEAGVPLPPRLLDAIGLVESGRPDPKTGRVTPWPWTINVAGAGAFFDSKAAAIAAVRAAQAAGIHSIDVGCAQINLLHHPNAFASLDEAFDPRANARYAALFLQRLHAAAGDWSAAVANYHSMTPDIGTPYVRRVAAIWPELVPGARVAPPDLAAQIDPQHVMTPEFRARLLRDAAERTARDVRMGLRPPAPVAQVALAHKPRKPMAPLIREASAAGP